jgi:hypothetical protein
MAHLYGFMPVREDPFRPATSVLVRVPLTQPVNEASAQMPRSGRRANRPPVVRSIDVDTRWRFMTTLGPVDDVGVAIAGTDPHPIRRNIQVVTSEPVLIGLYVGSPALPLERVTGVQMYDWTARCARTASSRTTCATPKATASKTS